MPQSVCGTSQWVPSPTAWMGTRTTCALCRGALWGLRFVYPPLAHFPLSAVVVCRFAAQRCANGPVASVPQVERLRTATAGVRRCRSAFFCVNFLGRVVGLPSFHHTSWGAPVLVRNHLSAQPAVNAVELYPPRRRPSEHSCEETVSAERSECRFHRLGERRRRLYTVGLTLQATSSHSSRMQICNVCASVVHLFIIVRRRTSFSCSWAWTALGFFV